MLTRIVILMLCMVTAVWGHGYLMVPPSRNAMWREGFPNPVDFDDNELFCGGYGVQWNQNDGKCGVCGDPWQAKKPRPHEAGGVFGNGIIARRYNPGQTIDIVVVLTAGHGGFFELRLCPHNSPKTMVSQECLDKHLLFLDGTNESRYHIGRDFKKGTITYRVRLPDFIVCTQCVIQWKYTTGNTWGSCANGSQAVGCGPQENFVNCADVAIHTSTGGFPPSFIGSNFVDNPYLLYFRDFSQFGGPFTPLIVRDQVCIAATSRDSNVTTDISAQTDDYCRIHCLRYPPACPQDTCFCPKDCWAIGDVAGEPGADQYCLDLCLVSKNREKCRKDHCQCI